MPQHRSLSRISLGSLAAVTLSAALMLPDAARADWEKITITKVVTKQLVVRSNGASYTQVPILGNLIADVRVQADAGVWGEIKEWTAWLKMRRETGAVLDFPGFAHHKTYASSEHIKSVDRQVQLAVPKSAWQLAVVDSCNRLADDLRAEGLTDTQIFAQDRTITYGLEATWQVEMSGPDNLALDQAAAPFPEEVDVVCQKWAGASIPQASGSFTVSPAEVVGHGLSVYAVATMNGACKIRLDGWITTDKKNADVSFRYTNVEGKQSQVWTVNTGDNKTATFSHWYDIPNTEWKEIGAVRMVGTSHEFQSELASYVMDCVEGGPDTIAANDPPLVTLSAVPQGEVMVQGFICPQVVKLIGVLQGRGNFSGKAVFFGRNYLSPLRDYSITHGQKVLLGAEAALDWDDIPLPAAPNGLLAQAREFGFNVTNADNKVIASVPKRLHFIECKRPKLNPAVQVRPGGLTTENRDPQQSGATAGPRLRALPQAAPPRRLQPRTFD